MSEQLDLLAAARAALAASSTATDRDVAAMYLAAARNALAKVRLEAKELASLVVAREAELARLASPKEQTTLAEVKAS